MKYFDYTMYFFTTGILFKIAEITNEIINTIQTTNGTAITGFHREAVIPNRPNCSITII